MGEEIREPKRTIPRAIIITLVASVILYILVSLAMLGAIGADGSPLFAAGKVMTAPGIQPIISIANLSAIRLKSENRFLPAWISWLGLLLCILMAFSLPFQSISSG